MEKKSTEYLKSSDLMPIPHSEKNISSFGFFVMWVGMAVVLAAFAIGGSGVASIPLGLVIAGGLFGSVVIGLSITITGDIGVEHGLSFPVYMRAPFGLTGTHIPSIVRAIAASCWFGLNTYFGATALNAIFNTLWGFDHWFICFLVFALAQLINTALGIKALERFADLAAPIIIIISLWMYYSLSSEAQEAGRSVWAWAENPVHGGEAFNSFFVVAFAVMGFWATLACDIPTISRFIKAPKNERNWWKRNKGTLIGTLIAMPIVETFMIAIGAVAYIAVSNSDPVAALQQTAGGLVLVVLMIMIVFAQWSTNTTANVIPAATIYSNVGGPKVPFWVGVFIAGLVGSIVQPWLLFDILTPVLLVVGAILSAIVGILFADYYLVRKRRVNVPDLYETRGQFRFMNGINWAGYISWVVGGLAGYLIMDYSFVVGFVVGGGVYYFLAKYWWFQKYKQAELEDPDDGKYLGITVGRDWIDEMNEEYDEQDIG